MKSHAELVASRRADGSTRLARLCGGGPLTLRPTGNSRRARVHLVAGVFGPLGGDHLTLHITVEPGAQLDVAAVAATLVLPSRTGESSSMRIRIDVGEGARLTLVAPPTVVCAGARHVIAVEAAVAADAELVLREETIRGRTGEPGGEVTLHTGVDVAARPVLKQTLVLDGDVGSVWTPRAVGGLLSIEADQKPPTMGHFAETIAAASGRAAWFALPRGAGHQLTVLAADPLALSRLLDAEQGQLPRYVV